MPTIPACPEFYKGLLSRFAPSQIAASPDLQAAIRCRGSACALWAPDPPADHSIRGSCSQGGGLAQSFRDPALAGEDEE